MAECTFEAVRWPAVSNDACDTSGAELGYHIKRVAVPPPNLFPEESCSSTSTTSEHNSVHHPDSEGDFSLIWDGYVTVEGW